MSLVSPIEKTGRTALERQPGARTHRLRATAYATGVLFLIVSLLDIATVAWPVQPGAVAWRFGTVGAASNYMLTLFFGVALLCWTAAWFNDRLLLRLISVAAVLATLVMVTLLGDFILSSLQLSSSVPPAERATFRIGVLKATTKYIAFAIGFLIVGFTGWRASRARS